MYIKKKLATAILSALLFGCGAETKPTSLEGESIDYVSDTFAEDIDLVVSFTGFTHDESINLRDNRYHDRQVTYEIKNIGSTMVSGHTFDAEFYLSEDPYITPDDIRLDNKNFSSALVIDGGESKSIIATIRIDSNYVTAGTYYIGAFVDPNRYYKKYQVASIGQGVDADTYERLLFTDTENFRNNGSKVNPKITISGSRLQNCVDDEFEPNDTLRQAKPIALNEEPFAINFCNDRADWFEFIAPYDGIFEVDTSDGIKVMYIVDVNGDVVGFNESTDAHYNLQGLAGKAYYFNLMPGFTDPNDGEEINYISIKTPLE
jgi:hypothetical protein